jgi:hypothetical protein
MNKLTIAIAKQKPVLVGTAEVVQKSDITIGIDLNGKVRLLKDRGR